ncbi:MAG: MBL fold metallo-hydrolase [Pyrinomonadaceae bacterium]
MANRLQCDPSWPIGCDDGRSVQVGPFALIGLASAHETLERDAKGRYKHLGYIIRGDRWSIYHSGDAVPYQGMAERLRQLAAPHAVDVALLPINGRAPERGVPGNFFGDEAATLAKDIHAQLVIPMHYDMFAFNTASPKLFAGEAKRLGQNYRILGAGERWSSETT